MSGVFVSLHRYLMRLHGFLDFFRLLSRNFRPFGGRIFMAVWMNHLRFFAGLNRFRRSFLRLLAVVLFLLDDFLIVGNVSWIGHRLMIRPCGIPQPYPKTKRSRNGEGVGAIEGLGRWRNLHRGLLACIFLRSDWSVSR